MIQPEKTSKYAVVVSLLTLCFIACNGKASEISNHSSNPIVTIERFDKGLPSYVQETDSAQIFLFIDKYTPFFPVYCRHILGLGDAPSFQKGLKMFLSNEAISQLYADTETKLSNDTVWITELQNAFLRYNELFAPQKRPRILTHISGLNQSIVTIDTTLLSVSLDCYLGENYPLYEQRYYNYERNLHESNRIPIDVVEVWLRTLYPYQSQRNALLDRMIYEGKILYCLSQIFPRTNEYVLLGYSDKQAQWCKENEAEIWKQLIGKKHLFNTESMLINKYIEPAPFVSVLHQDAPGRLGRWIGLQIIKAYANEKKKEAIEIIETTDNGGEILSASKYNG